MTIFYSKTTAGFYDSLIHADTQIPSDAVEITPEYQTELLNAQSNGKLISSDNQGYPALVDRPMPTTEQLAEQIRHQRNSLISDSDWKIQRHLEQTALAIDTTLTPVQYTALLKYRNDLRGIPEQEGFPGSVIWPTLS